MKQFFKPTLGKLILFILFPILMWYVASVILETPCFGTCYSKVIELIFEIAFVPISSILKTFFGSVLDTDVYLDNYGLIDGTLFFVNLFYWYFLSCLFVWLYHKIRKPKVVLDKPRYKSEQP